VEESEKFDLVALVAKNLAKDANPDIKVNDIDGVRVTTPDGWWLLRASNTQNVLVTRAESQTLEGLENLKQMVTQEVEKIGYAVSFDQTAH
jgi:phosphomannomutase